MAYSLSALDLLSLWERGANQLPVEQGLLLLRAAWLQTSAADTSPSLSIDLRRMTIGQRDRALLALRREIFGSTLNGLAVCPACSERVEISFPLDEVFATYHIQPDLFIPSHPPETYQLETGDYKLTFRLPDSLDLIKASSATNAVSARLILLEGCLLDASNHGQTVRAVDLPDDVVHILTAHMDEVDPLANVTLPLTCPACSHGWEVIFDIVSFFWAEINAWAERILREVHTLASAYGWREMDILSMSAQRRQKYLELVGA